MILNNTVLDNADKPTISNYTLISNIFTKYIDISSTISNTNSYVNSGVNIYSFTNIYNSLTTEFIDKNNLSKNSINKTTSLLLDTIQVTTVNFKTIIIESNIKPTLLANSINLLTSISLSNQTVIYPEFLDTKIENITSKKNESIISTVAINESILTIQQSNFPNCIEFISPTSIIMNNSICSTNSPYQPLFEYDFYFGYPILQIIACNDGKIVLNCPKDQFINIYSSYYGIQQNTQTDCTLTSTIESPSICYRSDSFNIIYSLCQNKTSCYLHANRAYFGDPCIGFDNKQLFIQYQCVDSSILTILNNCPKITKVDSICPSLTSSSQYQKTWCDISNITLTCFNNKIIKILCAVYGIDPNIRKCGLYYIGAPTSCNSNSTLTNIKTACNDRTSCSLNSSKLINICPKAYAPILIIQYECIDIPTGLLPYCNYSNSMLKSTSEKTPILIGKCSSQSSIYPSFLSSSNFTSNEFLIYQQIACYGSKLNIYCKPNSVIHIYSTYFGIQSLTNSLCVSNNRMIGFEEPTQCFIPFSYDRIVQKCEYKNYCIIESTETGLNISDPCPDFQTQEQLFIQYQCIDLNFYNITLDKCVINKETSLPCSSLEENAYEGTWCDNGLGNGSSLYIKCSNDRLITILCSFYGLHSSIITCNEKSLTLPICYYNNTLTTLELLCNGKMSCFINDFSLTFLDACGGLSKSLYVSWKCF